MSEEREEVLKDVLISVTFSFLSIAQRWRDGQFPALSCAHALQTLIPTLQYFLKPKSEPYWIFISIFTAAQSHKDASRFSFKIKNPTHTYAIITPTLQTPYYLE